MIIFYLAKRITSPIIDLTEVARRISGGDFSQQAKTESSNEIGVLALTFNEMTSKIRDYQQGLEQKVAERTRELERMNKLMVGRELKMIELKKEIERLKGK